VRTATTSITPQGWTETRGHDHPKAEQCSAECRFGQPWPTLRLLPGERGRNARITTTAAGRAALAELEAKYPPSPVREANP